MTSLSHPAPWQKQPADHGQNLKFPGSFMDKSKKKQVKLILITYFIEPHISKIVSPQPIINIKIIHGLFYCLSFGVTSLTSRAHLVPGMFSLHCERSAATAGWTLLVRAGLASFLSAASLHPCSPPGPWGFMCPVVLWSLLTPDLLL